MDTATQAIPVTKSTASQSEWLPKRNRALQYETRTTFTTASSGVGTTNTTGTPADDTKNEEDPLAAFLSFVLAPIEVCCTTLLSMQFFGTAHVLHAFSLRCPYALCFLATIPLYVPDSLALRTCLCHPFRH